MSGDTEDSNTPSQDIPLSDIHNGGMGNGIKSGDDSTETSAATTNNSNKCSDGNATDTPIITFTKHRGCKKCTFVVVGLVVFVIGIGFGFLVGYVVFQMDESNNSRPYREKTIVTESSDHSFMDHTQPPNIPECVCPTIVTRPPIKPECSYCQSRNPDQSRGNETDTSPFAPLTFQEMQTVYLLLESKGLIKNSYSLHDDRVTHMFLYPVNKDEALDYLDNSGQFPGRYAMAMVARGSRDVPDVMEYKVGPLHVDNESMTIQNLRKEGEILFNQRPYDPVEDEQMDIIARPHVQAMKDLLSESFDGASFQVAPRFHFLPSNNPDERLATMYLFYREPGVAPLRILPVTCLLHHHGTYTAEWYASDFYYLSQGPFSSGTELAEAYNNGTLRKIKYPSGYWNTHRGEFEMKFNESLPKRPLSDIPPPQTYEPEGPRYTIKGNRVTWMDWEFEFSSNPMTGPQIFDVKFKGERIAYEISLQDITLIYSTQTSGAGPPVLSDTEYQLGTFNAPRAGVDCPARASKLRASLFFYSLTRNEEAACVFEADGQQALWRHGQAGLSDHYLVVRFTMDLGNYDYTAEWRFHLDGSLEMGLAASGYLYGAFWDPEDPLLNGNKAYTPFGFRLRDYMLGPIHDHAFVFKVDLDIVGTENSFETIHWRQGTTLEAFQSRSNVTEKPGYFYFNHTRYLEHEFLENERGFVNNPLEPKYFLVSNEKESNYWGARRAYRIAPHSHVAENLKEHMMLDAFEQLKHQIAVTRRRDSEQHASESWYSKNYPAKPGKGLSASLNNETVRNTDLVLWITEKFLHAPCAEDLPMTISVHHGFTLKPYNFFDRTQVFDVQSHYDTFREPYTPDACYQNPNLGK